MKARKETQNEILTLRTKRSNFSVDWTQWTYIIYNRSLSAVISQYIAREIPIMVNNETFELCHENNKNTVKKEVSIQLYVVDNIKSVRSEKGHQLIG